MYQQSSFQSGQSFGSATNRYQPVGNVQSQYQGQLTRSAASGPVTAHAGYQAGMQQSFGQSSSPGAFSSPSGGTFQSSSSSAGQQGMQHPVYRATNARQQDGPVIQHAGYQAGMQQNFGSRNMGQSNFNQSNFNSSNMNPPNFNPSNFTGRGSAFQSSSFSPQQASQHPVYRATNARQQDGPVVQRVGYQAGTAQHFSQPNFAGQGSAFQSSSFSPQQASQHPVYRAANARQQDGPVIQQFGYQSGGMGMQQNSF